MRRAILEQFPLFAPDGVVPVPCNPDCLAMTYALKLDGQLLPLTRFVPPATLVEGSRNSIVVERELALREQVFEQFSTAHSPESHPGSLRDLLCCLPRVATPAGLSYRNVFRVLIMQFFDAHSFDLRGVKKSCVHAGQPSGEIMPFDTFDLFYRDGLRERLAELRQLARPETASDSLAQETP